MAIREYRILRGETWDASFSAKLGKAASKLYREIYAKAPASHRSRHAHRNPVKRFPCGIIEQAYRQLREQGVPLTGNVTPKTVWREKVREPEEKKALANRPATATKDEAQDQPKQG
jgi:hypothetical protein